MHEKKAMWIWYPGDFEIYHNLKLNLRREERGFIWPALWKLDDCWHSVVFQKTATLTKDETILVRGNGVGFAEIDGKRYPYNRACKLGKGEHTVTVYAAKYDGLPSVYVSGDAFLSDTSWQADNHTGVWKNAGANDMFTEPDANPEVFPFCYQLMQPVSTTRKNGGILYDYGKETFCKLKFKNLHLSEALTVCYGETEQEALDVENCYIRDCIPQNTATYEMPARAFRYIFIPNAVEPPETEAWYEYLDIARKGEWKSSDDMLNRIWDISAYTLQLNSREFFLDGIKRDRWVWSGDAFQSYLTNYYLFFDQDIVKRTTLALRGKDPFVQHINTILDYSLYWVIGMADYYRYTGDLDFVKSVWDKVKSLLDACRQQVNPDGFLIGYPGVWVFVDWADIDYGGAVCAIQMLYILALEAAGKFSDLFNDTTDYQKTAEDLREKLNRYFWDAEKHAYIDCYESGKRAVSRHANIFAILYGFVDAQKLKAIEEHVFQNDEVPAITTPYFKFFELCAMCEIGEFKNAYDAMISYWGGMVKLGATSVWEEYDPRRGLDVSMYGDPYGKSMCHAWGASPIYLLGRYFLGVSPTSDGYRTFECKPNPIENVDMQGTVPILDGKISITMKDGKISVFTDRAGGTLVYKDKRMRIPVNETLTIDI